MTYKFINHHWHLCRCLVSYDQMTISMRYNGSKYKRSSRTSMRSAASITSAKTITLLTAATSITFSTSPIIIASTTAATATTTRPIFFQLFVESCCSQKSQKFCIDETEWTESKQIDFLTRERYASNDDVDDKLITNKGIGCGTIGRAVASHTRRPWFKYSHYQCILRTFILFVNFEHLWPNGFIWSHQCSWTLTHLEQIYSPSTGTGSSQAQGNA